MVRKVIE